MTEAQKIVWRFFSLMPFDRRIRSAYSDCPEDARTFDTWSAIEKLFISVTPKVFREVTRVTPANSGTTLCVPRLLGFRKTIHTIYYSLGFRLFLVAQVWTCWISVSRLSIFRAGMTRSVSSANLNISFPLWLGEGRMRPRCTMPVQVRIPGWSWPWWIRNRIRLLPAQFGVNVRRGMKWPSCRHSQAYPAMQVSPRRLSVWLCQRLCWNPT